MINVWLVSQALRDISDLSDDEIKKAMTFCVIACREFSDKLKKPEFADEPAVITACAACALYRYTLSQKSDGDFSSFKAGDVTVSRSENASRENAASLRDEAIICAAPFLNDMNFIFKAVDV